MPTLTQLEYIVAVEKYRHFGQAARACHISQPSLSMQIQKAEEELGITLFDRLKKPVLPTDIGAAFIEQARSVLREHQKLLALSQSQKTELQGEFSLAIIPTLAPYVTPLFIDTFSKRYPKVQLRIDEMKTNSIVEALKNDSIDAGLLATPLLESGLKEQVIFYEPFYLYLSPKHPLIKKKKIREEDLDAADMWLLQDGHCLRNQVVKFCSIKNQETGIYKNVQFEGGNLETLRYLIKRSHGYTMIPHLFYTGLPADERRELVREFEGKAPPMREVSLVYRREQWKVDILTALKNAVLENLPTELRSPGEKTKIPRTSILKP